MSDELTRLSYWFPKIEAAGLPVPRTRIVRTDLDLVGMLDGLPVEGFEAFISELTAAGDEVGGRPFFLRTGHGSGKHEWRDTCYVDTDDLGWHVARLVEWSHTVDMFGLPTDEWVVRELIPTEPWFECDSFGGFPVTREFRFFIRDDRIEHWQPYWPADAVAQGRPNVEDWRDRLTAMSRLADEELQELATLAGQASGAVGGGYWSADFLQDASGDWWLTDMAEGERSFRYEPISA